MQYWTWGQLKEKIENDMDLQEEPDILSEGELMGYANDAIDICEQYFIKLGDYFLSTSQIALVHGQRDYDLPADIYATKIRKVITADGAEVRQMKDLRYANDMYATIGGAYCYLIINSAGASPKMRLYPTPATSGSLDIFYTRNANRLTDATDPTQEIDVPEAMGFIVSYIKMRIYEKERNPLYQLYRDELARQEELLMDALAQRIDDENNLIEPDVSDYQEMFI